MKKKSSPIELVLRNLKATGDCIEYAGATRNGYGVIKAGGRRGKVMYCHRVVYEAKYGEIPADKVIRHKCHNRRCCNIDHLEIGTAFDNMQDMVKAGRCNPQPGRTNILGVSIKWDRGYLYWIARRNHKRLYHGKDFFEACCAVKSWEISSKVLQE